jgi:ferredoxin-NADP reductase
MTENQPAGGLPLDKPTYTAELTERRWLTDRAFEVSLTRPENFHFAAGQNLCFFHEGDQRYYALTSTTADPQIQLCIQMISGGVFTPYIADAQIGTGFTFSGPYGYFTFRTSRRRPVFIATDIGIAPFLSFARAGVCDFTLIHLVFRREDLLYENFFRSAASSYVPCIAENPDAPLPTGAVIDHLEKHLPVEAHDFYLCGRQDVIRDVTLFIDERYEGSLVFTEIFHRSA